MAKSPNNCDTLFPILDKRPLGGVARLASEATHADDGHLVEFKAMQARSILNRSVSKRMGWMAWSINPYRGCEFGCKYCYARYTHQFLRPEPVPEVPAGSFEAPEQSWALAFEREIYLKENAAWLLEQELRRVGGKIRDSGEEIALGTATDPYQPIERRVGITRSLLEVLARQQGLRIGIITKSNLITRDVDVLKEIAGRNRLVVHITVTTVDAELARRLEPRAPRPDLRLEAVRKLSEAGVMTGVLCCPLLPGINDTSRALDGVASRAAAAGAVFMGANPLFLKSCSRPTYLSFVREHFPALMGEYEKRFARRDFADAAYRRSMALLVKKACRRHGLAERASEALTREIEAPGRKAPQREAGVLTQPQRMLFA
jgi:DNA repair photolyase